MKKTNRKKGKQTKRPTESHADLDYKLYVSIFKEFLNAYKIGKVEFSLVGPRVNVGFSSYFAKEIMKKYDLDEDLFRKIVTAVTMTLHHVLSKEDESEIQFLIDRNQETKAKNLQKKFKFVQEYLKQFPELREQYLVQTYCKSFFIRDFSWEADVKFSHSPVEYSEKEPPIPFAVGKIRITLGMPEYPIEELKATSFYFEASYYDVENMIRYLEDLRSSLLKLREKLR